MSSGSSEADLRALLGKGRGRGRGLTLKDAQFIGSLGCEQRMERVEEGEDPEDRLICSKGCGAFLRRRDIASHSCFSFLLEVNNRLRRETESMQSLFELNPNLVKRASSSSLDLSQSLDEEEKQLFVRNIPLDVNEELLTQMFSKFGTISAVRLKRGASGSSSCAFIRLEDKEAIGKVLAQQPIRFFGHQYDVEPVKKRKGPSIEMQVEKKDEEALIKTLREMGLNNGNFDYDLRSSQSEEWQSHREECRFDQEAILPCSRVLPGVGSGACLFHSLEDQNRMKQQTRQERTVASVVCKASPDHFAENEWIEMKGASCSSLELTKQTDRGDDRIFVGNIPLDVNETVLKQMFSKFETISAIRLNSGAQSTGNDILVSVEKQSCVDQVLSQTSVSQERMERVEETETQSKEIALNPIEAENRMKQTVASDDQQRCEVFAESNEGLLSVEKKDETIKESASGSSSVSNQISDRIEKKCELFVRNIPLGVSKDLLKQMFSKFGTISDIRLNQASSSRQYGFVRFKDESAVYRVLSQKPISLHGHVYRVEESIEWEKPSKTMKVLMEAARRLDVFEKKFSRTKKMMEDQSKEISALREFIGDFIHAFGVPKSEGIDVFVGKIPKSVTSGELRRLLTGFGEVIAIRYKDSMSKEKYNFAFIRFTRTKVVEDLIQKKFAIIEGHRYRFEKYVDCY